MTLTTPQAILLCITYLGSCVYLGHNWKTTELATADKHLLVAEYEAIKSVKDAEAAKLNAINVYIALESKRTNLEGYAKKAQMAEARLQKACRINKGRC